jgi:hypothetical protein
LLGWGGILTHRLDQPLTSKFDDALQFASQLHREQARKNTQIPYISHPLAVASLVLEHGGTETQAIAALLHDVVEDCGGYDLLTAIEQRFGKEVAEIVCACSDSFTTGPKPEWKERRKSHLKHLREAKDSVMLVTAADKLHNLTSILHDLRREGQEFWDRFNAGPDQQMWYYEAMIQMLKERLHNPVVGRLEDTLSDVQNEIIQQEYAKPYSPKHPLYDIPVFEPEVVERIFGRGEARRGYDFERIFQFVEGNLRITRTRATDIAKDIAADWTFKPDQSLAEYVAKVYFAGVLDGAEATRRQAELDSRRAKS